MSSERVLSNARVVSAERVFVGSVLLRDGLIAAVDEGRSHLAGAEDLGGDYLLPGLVELHTDNLEKHMTPRPGVDWPSASAVLAHDAQIVAAGITTVFDALSIGDVNPKGKRMQQLPKMLEAIGEAAASGDARADHRLHLRCEVSHPQTLEVFRELVEHPLVQLVSVMDHAPGQRQFARLEKYREYYQGKYHLSDAEMDAFIVEQVANSERYSDAARAAIVDVCQGRGLSVASHDDATLAHVRESTRLRHGHRRVPDHRGGRQGQPRARPAGADGRAQRGPRRFPLGQRGGGATGGNRRAGYPFQRLLSGQPAACGLAARRRAQRV